MASKNRFKGIVRNVTLSREDMKKLLELPIEEWGNWSPVKVVLLQDPKAVAHAMARSMVDMVAGNNRLGKVSSFILPVGPVAQYPIAAEMSNKEGVSWANAWTFNMDEYLDWENRPISVEHSMSFHRAMDEGFFNQLDAKLTVPKSQRWFPDPFNPDAIDEKIEEVTGGQGVDICFGGIGEHGHVAFNESPDLMTHYAHLTPDEFKQSKSRVLPHLNPETWARAFRNPLYTLCPPGAVTLGMKVILGAKRIELATQGTIARIAAMHPPTMDFPVTYIQEHADAKEKVVLYVAKEISRGW